MKSGVGRLAFSVRGRVQGVGFRYFVSSTAEQLNLVGWVRNQPDLTVEGEVQGLHDAIEKMKTYLARGPRWSRVDEVTFESKSPSEDPEQAMEIRRP